MSEEMRFVTVPKDDWDKLLGMCERISAVMSATADSAAEDYPALMTMNDIKKCYGIGRDKWRDGVRKGIFPGPVKGFDRPKRWERDKVAMVLASDAA